MAAIGDATTVEILSEPEHGFIRYGSSGRTEFLDILIYTPDRGFAGSDRVEIQVLSGREAGRTTLQFRVPEPDAPSDR